MTGIATVPTNSKSLLMVATHEIGHSLGLQHSSVVDSIMNPIYQTKTAVELYADDVLGIQSLYGKFIFCLTANIFLLTEMYSLKPAHCPAHCI